MSSSPSDAAKIERGADLSIRATNLLVDGLDRDVEAASHLIPGHPVTPHKQVHPAARRWERVDGAAPRLGILTGLKIPVGARNPCAHPLLDAVTQLPSRAAVSHPAQGFVPRRDAQIMDVDPSQATLCMKRAYAENHVLDRIFSDISRMHVFSGDSAELGPVTTVERVEIGMELVARDFAPVVKFCMACRSMLCHAALGEQRLTGWWTGISDCVVHALHQRPHNWAMLHIQCDSCAHDAIRA